MSAAGIGLDLPLDPTPLSGRRLGLLSQKRAVENGNAQRKARGGGEFATKGNESNLQVWAEESRFFFRPMRYGPQGGVEPPGWKVQKNPCAKSVENTHI